MDCEKPADEWQLAEYKTLVELLLHQHTRYNDFNRMCLYANAILLGLLARPLGSLSKSAHTQTYLVAGGCLGVGLCLVWVCTILRLNADSALRFWQLRDREASADEKVRSYLEGYAYHRKKAALASHRLTEYGGRMLRRPRFLSPAMWFRAQWAGLAFPGMFLAAYGFLVCSACSGL